MQYWIYTGQALAYSLSNRPNYGPFYRSVILHSWMNNHTSDDNVTWIKICLSIHSNMLIWPKPLYLARHSAVSSYKHWILQAQLDRVIFIKWTPHATSGSSRYSVETYIKMVKAQCSQKTPPSIVNLWVTAHTPFGATVIPLCSNLAVLQ